MKQKISLSEQNDYSPSGVKFGGEKLLKCSACDKPLMKIVITRPEEKDPITKQVIEWRLMALCPYCGDHSFEEVIKGGWTYSGIEGPNELLITEVSDLIEDYTNLKVCFKVVAK